MLFNLKCDGIILFTFAMVTFFLLFLTLGYIVCFFNLLFASHVLRSVSHFLYFVNFCFVLCCFAINALLYSPFQ